MAEALTNGDALTVPETESLTRLEATVERGLASFVEVGNALLAIREKRLFRAVSPTFEGYCQVRWGFSRQHASRLIQASEIVSAFCDVDTPNSLSPMGDKTVGDRLPAPENERQARALGGVPEPDRPAVWTKTVEAAPKDANGKPHVTAAQVKRVAEGGRADCNPPGAQGGPDEPEQPAPLYDSALVLIPPHLRPVFAAAPLFDKAIEHFRQITTLAHAIGDGPAAAHLKVAVAFARDLDNARSAMKFARPHVVCPHCRGKGSGNGCSAGTGCRGLGWMTADQYANVPAELKGPASGKGRAA